jgi:hypothetical protein
MSFSAIRPCGCTDSLKSALKKSDSAFWSVVYRRDDSVVVREIAGETLLVPIRGDLAAMQRIFTLNPVGAFIWEQLDGVRTLAEARDALLERFEVDREQVDRDVMEFLREVREAGLIGEKG